MDATALAEEALERLRRIIARWPRPQLGEGVRADALRAGLAPLLPLAEAVLALPLGYGKGFYPGAGYLSGSSRITADDHKTARAVEQDVNVILPYAGTKPIDRELWSQIRAHAYRLLGLATDLDATQGELAKVSTKATAAWDRWASLNAGGPVVRVGGARPGWIAARFRDRQGATWRWTGARGVDEAGRYVQALRSSRGEEMRIAEIDVEAFVRDGELVPLADEGSLAAAMGQATPGQRPVRSAQEERLQASLDRLTRFVAAFPKPGPGQRVPARAAAIALEPLRPLAQRVFAMKVGDKKGTAAPPSWISRALSFVPAYVAARAIAGPEDPGTGYLTGSATITADDLATARAVLNTLDATLPLYTSPLLEPGDYVEIKRQAHRLLMIGTDLDADTTAGDQVARLWQAFKESAQDLAGVVQRGGREGMDVLTKVLIALSIGAGAALVVSARRK